LSWTDTVGNFAKKLQGNGFANDIGLPTLLFDLASVSSNDKNWVGDAFNIAGDTFRTGVLGLSFPIRKASGFAIQKALLPAAQVSYETGGRYLREPLSAALTTVATGDVKRAWENREEISPGQALAYLQSKFDVSNTMGFDEGFDIFNPNDRKDFETDWNLRTLTGAYDTFFTTVTDPLGKLGKAAGLARKAYVTRPVGAVDANAQSLARDFFMPKVFVRQLLFLLRLLQEQLTKVVKKAENFTIRFHGLLRATKLLCEITQLLHFLMMQIHCHTFLVRQKL